MKKTLLISIILFTSLGKIFAQNADGIKGTWLNSGKDVKIEIYRTGSKYVGKIIWAKDIYESDGTTPKRDINNLNENLRNRTIINLVILSGFSYDDGEWTGGEIYNPTNGKTYKGRLYLDGSRLEIRGYVGSPIFGKTMVWTRTS